jgi:hypothetical protein
MAWRMDQIDRTTRAIFGENQRRLKHWARIQRAFAASAHLASAARPRDLGRSRLDKLLPRLSGACGVRRLQAVGHRAREPQDDARPLPADQEHAGELQPQEAGLFLGRMMPASVIGDSRLFSLAPVRGGEGWGEGAPPRCRSLDEVCASLKHPSPYPLPTSWGEGSTIEQLFRRLP